MKLPLFPVSEKYYKHLTLRNTLFNIILFVTPFLILFLFLNFEVSTIIKHQIYGHLSESVKENTRSIQTFLRSREIDLKSLSRPDIDDIHDISRFSSIFRTFIQEKEWYDFISIADMTGEIFFTINTEIKANISDREYFIIASRGRYFNSGIFQSDILNKPVMILACPIINLQDQIIGVMASSLNLEKFHDLLFEMRMGETSEIFLVDSNGTLLSPTRLGGIPLKDSGFLTEGENPHIGEKGVKTHRDYRDKKVLCAYQKLADTDIYVVSEMDEAEALTPLRKVNRIILAVFLPLITMMIFISNISSRRITSLLRRLTNKLEIALKEARSKKKEVDKANIELGEKVQESVELTRELKLSEEYIRNLIDSISLGVIGLDREGKITHFNKEAAKLHCLENAAPGRSIFETLPWPDDPDIRNSFDAAITGPDPSRVELKLLDTGREQEYFNLSFFPIFNGKKQVHGVSLLIENVTERKKLREQLAEYEKLSALSQLAMGAAHEINNPLLGISAFLENLIEETGDLRQKEEIHFVLENVYRISETIRGLLNFARPTPPQFTKVNINHLVDETLSFLSHQPIFRKLTVNKQFSASLPPITADLNQIRQALINLFINAAQSMSGSGELRVETSKVKFKEFIQIDIHDTGSGISPDNLRKIFDPFFTTKKKQGTGLGLSITHSYIKNHNGSIAIQSELNKGTTVTIQFPIRQKGRPSLRDEETIS